MSLRRISLLLGACLCLTSSPLLWSQDSYYQDKSGAVPLWYSTEKLVLKFTEAGGGEMGSALASDPAFDLNRAPEQTMHGFYFAWLVQGTNVAAVLGRLDTNQYFEIANPVYLEAGDTARLVCFDRVSVKFLDSTPVAIIDSLNTYWNVTIVDSITGIPNYYVLKVTNNTGRSVLEIAIIYEQDSRTEFAIPDFLANIQPEYSPVDPLFWNQWNFHNTGQMGGANDADIDAVEAWDFGLGDATVVIAVLDEGVEDHSDMIYPYKFVNGYDYAGLSILSNPLVPDGDPSPGDSCVAHGMACAGLAAGSHNYYGIAGLCSECKVMPIKIFDDFGRLLLDYKQIATAIAHARLHGASLMTNSWSLGTCDSTSIKFKEVKFAVRYVNSVMPVFFAAGNGLGCVKFPANMQEVIAVGATDSIDGRWWYSPTSSTGDSMDLVAPSGDVNLYGDIWTMDITGNRGYNPPENCRYGPLSDYVNRDWTRRFGGTSASCPQAAGTAALVKSYDIKADWRNLTVFDIKEIIKHSADDLGAPGWDSNFGWGRLNAMKAMITVARGDVNKDGDLTLADEIWIVNYIFHGWTITPHRSLGDATCDGMVTLADAIYLLAYLFQGGPAPGICYLYN